MLIGKVGEDRVEAASAVRGVAYVCPSPECGGALILKRGRRIAAHFAHKPPARCEWAALETAEHRVAKLAFQAAFAGRGLRTELEVYAPFPDGGLLRADVMVWSPNGTPVAFEFQKTSIGLDEIEARAFTCARNGHAQIWIPIIKSGFWKSAVETGPRQWRIERYPAGEFEKWISGLYKAKNTVRLIHPAEKFWKS